MATRRPKAAGASRFNRSRRSRVVETGAAARSRTVSVTAAHSDGIGARKVDHRDDVKKLAQLGGALGAENGIEPLLRLAPCAGRGAQSFEAGFGQTNLLAAVIAAAGCNRNEPLALQRPNVTAKRRPVHDHL